MTSAAPAGPLALPMTGSIQRRVVVMATAGLAIALLLSSIVLYLAMAVALRSEFTIDLEARARALAALAEFDPVAGRVDVDLSAVAEVVTTDMGFQLWSPDGRLMAGDQELGTWSEYRVGSAPGAIVTEVVRFEDRPALRLTRRCRGPRHGNVQDETLVAVVIVGTEAMDHHLAQLRKLLVLVALGTVIVAVGFQTWILRRSLRPLRVLADDIARRDRAEAPFLFSGHPRPVELMPVAQRLDDLMARIAEVLARERRIGAAVAHELRTPLAGLRATVEVALLDPATSEAERRRADICLGIVEQMQRVLQALLMLARLDARNVVPRAVNVDLAACLASARDAADAVARERRLEWRWQVPAVCSVTTDRALIELVFGNLLGNAVAYADAGGDVTVGMTAESEAVRITISNSGSRVASSDAGRVCERFWRGDASRSDTAHHCGLGLALCQDVVQVLGGSLEVTTDLGERFTVQVRLPNCP